MISSKRILLFASGTIAGSIGVYFILKAAVPDNVDRTPAIISANLETRSAVSPRAGQARDGIETGTSLERSRIAEIAERAKEDPAEALRVALAVSDPADRRQAVRRVARAWTWTDPQAAMEAAGSLSPSIGLEFREELAREWANLDADGFLSYAETAMDLESLEVGLEMLIPTDPERIFDIASRLAIPGTARNPIQERALEALAEHDPVLALQRLESVSAGMARDLNLSSVLSVYARNDADGALAWLDSQGQVSTSARMAVLRGIGLDDFDRAYELISVDSPVESVFSDRSFASAMVEDATYAATVASDLLGRDASRADQMLESMVGYWVRRDPDSAITWMTDNVAEIDPGLARAIGLGLARVDLDGAIDRLGQLPPAIRTAWIPQIAGIYAREDPLGALNWVAQYQGQAFYDDARSQVVMQAADSNPEQAATLITSLSPGLQATAAPRIAAAWASRDPQAAAEWVLNLEGPAADSEAARSVVSTWMTDDLDAARRWAVDLPSGTKRDHALFALIDQSYGTSLDPRPILDLFESDETRRDATRLAVYRSSEAHRDIARELLETMLDDPENGAWAQETLDRFDGR